MMPGVVETDPTAVLCMPLPMPSPKLSIPARADKSHTTTATAGIAVYRRNETVSATSSLMTVEQVSMEAKSLFGLTYATELLVAASAPALATVLDLAYRDAFGDRLLEEKLFGTGVGEWQGVVGANCSIAVSKETGQGAATINAANVLAMAARCWGYGRSIWLANPNCREQIVNAVTDNGVPLWRGDVTGECVCGRPIYWTEHCKTLGTAGDIVLGDWSQYLVGTLAPVANASSMFVRFAEDERAFKFWTRGDGAPWWKSALTPKNGSATLSPFVYLETRS